jgi:carboxylesterase 2
VKTETDSSCNSISTDLAFTCTTQTLASAIQAAGRQSVWRYQYDAAFPNLQLFPNAGAWHSSEIPSVFGTYLVTSSFGPATPDQIKLSKYMQGAWAGFAKNPSGGPGWPKLGSAAGVELAALGGNVVPGGEQTVPLLTADFACPLLDPILLATNMAYRV